MKLLKQIYENEKMWQNSEIWWKNAFWYYTLVEKMVKQVEIGKKAFLNLLNLVKIP
jgi:hypothetical protein